MKKLVNAGIKSKAELAQRLMQGEKFLYGEEVSGCLLFFDGGKRGTPFAVRSRYRGIIGPIGPVLWDSYRELRVEKEVPWYENIPPEGVHCWVGVRAPVVVLIKKHESCSTKGHKFTDASGVNWTMASPVKKEDIVFLEDINE